MKITYINVSLGNYHDLNSTPANPRDLKALAAFLNALADSPETVDVHVGGLRLQMTVEEETPVVPPFPTPFA